MDKKIGLIGLGKMGSGLAARLLEKNWTLVVYDKNEKLLNGPKFKTAVKARDLKDLAAQLPSPKIIWLMLPAGKTVTKTIFGKNSLVKFLGKGDIIIDGGNSFYKDSIKRSEKLSRLGVNFMDVGVSGGPAGARNGACLMIGGNKKAFETIKPLLTDLSKNGNFHFIPESGAGHFIKMVHNGIEYGMMQAIAEGFNLLKKSPFNLDLEKIAELYNNGSVVESKLIGWLKKAFQENGNDLKTIDGKVGHTGEGEWTVKTARKMGIPVKIIEASLKFRLASSKKPDYTGKILSALREQFGGHKAKL